jgi:hypothetical protein
LSFVPFILYEKTWLQRLLFKCNLCRYLLESLGGASQKKEALNRLMKDNVALIVVLEALEQPGVQAPQGKRQLLCVANTHIHANTVGGGCTGRIQCDVCLTCQACIWDSVSRLLLTLHSWFQPLKTCDVISRFPDFKFCFPNSNLVPLRRGAERREAVAGAHAAQGAREDRRQRGDPHGGVRRLQLGGGCTS